MLASSLSFSHVAKSLKDFGNFFYLKNYLFLAKLCYLFSSLVKKDYVDPIVNLALVYEKRSSLQLAKQHLAKALACEPKHQIAHYNLANLYEKEGNYLAAIKHLEQALASPLPVKAISKIEILAKLVSLYDKTDHAEAAYTAYKQLVESIKENHSALADESEALLIQASLLSRMHQHDKALALAQQYEQKSSSHSHFTLHVLSLIFWKGGMYTKGLEYAQQAAAENPVDGYYIFNEALFTLQMGDYEKGWKLHELSLSLHYEMVYKNVVTAPEKFTMMLGTNRYWEGESLTNKVILLWTEQGLGDSIMMARFIPQLKEIFGAKKIVLFASAALENLMSTISAIDTIIDPTSAERIEYDVHASLLSLPYLVKNTLENIPPCPFLFPTHSDYWIEKVKPLTGLKVGLVWAGNPDLLADKLRSLELHQLAPLFEIEHVHFISLQKGYAAEQISCSGYPIIDWSSDFKSMLDTVQLIQELDLVIAVDTSIAHLAGAINQPIWLLNRFGGEWRWLINRTDSPWYPSMKIYNQEQPKDWQPVIAQIQHDLKVIANQL